MCAQIFLGKQSDTNRITTQINLLLEGCGRISFIKFNMNTLNVTS